MTKPELKISIVSDYICPFCYIAHKRLQCLREHYTLRVRWCFVEIHPETPAIGQAIDELNYTAQYWSALMENLNRVAEEEQMTLAPLDFTTNSRQALLLAESCKLLGPDVFNAVHERLFEAYFIDGQNIGDEQVLRKIGAELKIPEQTFKKAWADPFTKGPKDSVPHVLRPYQQYAASISVKSVPTFVIGDELITGVVERSSLMTAAEKLHSGNIL